MNILFFITHKTLGENHAEMVFKSISTQNTEKKFNKMIIYNTHPKELKNETLVNLFHKHQLSRVIGEITVFDYDDNTNKSLGGDIFAIKEFCKKEFNSQDRILLLKSDCCLSRNYFDVVLNINPSQMIHFVAPFVCAKKRVDDLTIIKYLTRDLFVRSDDITFFVEDSQQSPNNDFNTREQSITDESILFTSCTVTRDFSCHFISVGLLELIMIKMQSWGGCNFSKLDPYLLQSDRCFVVHKYHDIQSENRIGDREGLVREWLDS